MKELLERFNQCFGGTAKAVIVNDNLEIIIGCQTLIISLPKIIGGQSEPKA